MHLLSSFISFLSFKRYFVYWNRNSNPKFSEGVLWEGLPSQ
eukprot:bmy_10733T0